MKKRLRKKIATDPRYWASLPAGDFMVHKRTGLTISAHQLYALGVPVKRAQELLGRDFDPKDFPNKPGKKGLL